MRGFFFVIATSCLFALNNIGFAEPATQKPVAYLNTVQGTVQVISQGAPIRQPSPGVPLFFGDQVSTSLGSRVELYIPGSGIVSVGTDSQLDFVLQANQSGQNPMLLLKLTKGTLRAVFDTQQSTIRIETPYLAADVHGTRVIFSEEAVSLLEGRLQVYPKDRKGPIELFSGDAYVQGAVKPIPFDKLRVLEHSYDGIVEQTPYVVTHEQLAAMVVKELGHHLPEGWNAYSEELYFSLLSGSPVVVDATGFQALDREAIQYRTVKGEQVIYAVKAATLSTYLAVPTSEFFLKATRSGGPQYYTLSRHPTVLSKSTWSLRAVRVGPFDLNPGIYRLRVSLPEGGMLASVASAVVQPKSVEPEGGWRKDTIVRHEQLSQILNQILESRPKLSPERLASIRKQFSFGQPQDVVYGKDALLNLAVLRETEPLMVLPLGVPKAKPPAGLVGADSSSSAVSPILPTDLE